jgi:ABC-type Mn2+/Zn2+ transport system ATPase subunit
MADVPKSLALAEVRHLSVGHGRHIVLGDLNFTLAPGHITALLGAKGSGKTTLLKTLLGVLPALRGTITFHSTPKPQIGYVPQRERLDALFPLSAFEVALMGCYGRVPPGRLMGREENQWVLECLRQTEAYALARQPFAKLSGGQRQRVLIARALATRPGWLVLDEPTSGIDAAAARGIVRLLRQVNIQRRLPILLVHHDLQTARLLADDVIWLDQGRATCGPANELLHPERLTAWFAPLPKP